MIAYINIYKPTADKIDIEDYLDSIINYKGWGDPIKKIKYSPQEVLDNPKKYKDDYQRIMNADLKYPIIITKDGTVVDGVHRIVKASYLQKKQIKAYTFDNKLLKKFLLDTNKDFKKVKELTSSDLIMLFNKRFKCVEK
jgi:disulfide oxidoreductase YuzD